SGSLRSTNLAGGVMGDGHSMLTSDQLVYERGDAAELNLREPVGPRAERHRRTAGWMLSQLEQQQASFGHRRVDAFEAAATAVRSSRLDVNQACFDAGGQQVEAVDRAVVANAGSAYAREHICPRVASLRRGRAAVALRHGSRGARRHRSGS